MWMQTRHEIDPGTVDRIKKGTGTAWQKQLKPNPMIRELCEFGRIPCPKRFFYAGEPERGGIGKDDL